LLGQYCPFLRVKVEAGSKINGLFSLFGGVLLPWGKGSMDTYLHGCEGCKVNQLKTTGAGSKKKHAKQEAAMQMLTKLKSAETKSKAGTCTG
jgi:hypothetical protein